MLTGCCAPDDDEADSAGMDALISRALLSELTREAAKLKVVGVTNQVGSCQMLQFMELGVVQNCQYYQERTQSTVLCDLPTKRVL